MSALTRTVTFAACLAATAVLAPGCLIVADDDSSLTVVNDSDFVIEELYVTEVDNDDWGPNLIPEALFPDEEIEISLDCDVYAALLIDEDGVECEIPSIDLCFDDALWHVRNNTCSVWGIAKQQREAAAAAKGELQHESTTQESQKELAPLL